MTGPHEPIAPLRSLELDLPPSCLEFCPLLPSYFLVGTYHLQQGSGPTPGEQEQGSLKDEDSDRPTPREAQRRNGSLVTYRLSDNNNNFVHVHTEPRPSAVLDLHFQPASGRQDICGVAYSTGALEILKLSVSPTGASELGTLSTIRIPGLGEDVLFLSFGWHPSDPHVLAVTTSLGGTHILKLSEDYKSFKGLAEPVVSHSLEAWCVAIRPITCGGPSPTPHEPSRFTLFTGGDDSALQYLTCEVTDNGASEDGSADDSALGVQVIHAPVTARGHNAGVTAVLPLPLTPPGQDQPPSDLVVTGSYDDHIRVYAIAPLHLTGGLRAARLLAEVDLGGGVWRLRLIRLDQEGGATWRAWLLASCMHAGARIVRLQGQGRDACEVEVLGRFEEHKSMNYASDVLPGSRGDDPVCVSSSFYDKLMCLWHPRLGLSG